MIIHIDYNPNIKYHSDWTEYDEKEHPSLTMKIEKKCIIISDVKGIVDIIPLKNIFKCKRL